MSTTALAAAGAGAVGYGAGTLAYKGFLEGNAGGDMIGKLVALTMAKLGNEEAKRTVEVQVMLDGEQIAASVNTNNTRKSRRE